jgi:hypothetical protein
LKKIIKSELENFLIDQEKKTQKENHSYVVDRIFSTASVSDVD